jgi:hypothetical protein
VAALLLAAAYCAALGKLDRDQELDPRFGEDWRTYASLVPRWLPFLKPSIYEPAKLYAPPNSWIARRNLPGLTVLPHDGPLLYEAEGYRVQGIVALTRVLESIHLGWACLAWTLRLFTRLTPPSPTPIQ